MYHFDFYMPAKVLFGAGRLQSLHEEKLPGKKALIATTNGKSVKKYGYLAALEKELDTAGIAYELFDQIRPNPTSDNVMDGAALAKKLAVISPSHSAAARSWTAASALHS